MHFAQVADLPTTLNASCLLRTVNAYVLVIRLRHAAPNAEIYLSRDTTITTGTLDALSFYIKSNININWGALTFEAVNFPQLRVLSVLRDLLDQGAINSTSYSTLAVSSDFVGNPIQSVLTTLIAVRDGGYLNFFDFYTYLTFFTTCGGVCAGTMWFNTVQTVTVYDPTETAPGIIHGRFSPMINPLPTGLAVRQVITTPDGTAHTITPFVFVFPDVNMVTDFAAGQFGPTYFQRYIPTGNRILLNIYPFNHYRLGSSRQPSWFGPQKVIAIGSGVRSANIKPGALILVNVDLCFSQLININPQLTQGDHLLTDAEYCWVREVDVIGLWDESTNGANRFTSGNSQINQPFPATKFFRTDSYSSWK